MIIIKIFFQTPRSCESPWPRLHCAMEFENRDCQQPRVRAKRRSRPFSRGALVTDVDPSCISCAAQAVSKLRLRFSTRAVENFQSNGEK